MGALTATALVLAFAAPDDRALSLFRSVVEANPATDERLSCDYTTVATIQGRVLKERFTAEAGWGLVTINDKSPSVKDFERYEQGANDRARRGHPTEFDLATMALEDSVALADEDYETLTFSFALAPSEDEDAPPFLDQLQGTLTVRKGGFEPIRFVLETLDEVSPAPTVTIREFRQETTFFRDPEFDALLVESVHVAMRGKAFLFRTLDEDRRVRYGDYDCTPRASYDGTGAAR